MPGAGSIIAAADTPAAVSDSDSTDELGATNTSYATGATTVGMSFVAPTSTKVMIIWGARIEANTATRSALVSIQVATGASIGAGSVVSAANDDSAIETPQDGGSAGALTRLQCSRHRSVTGLTPGSAYNVVVMHKILGGAGNVDIFARDVDVFPIIT